MGEQKAGVVRSFMRQLRDHEGFRRRRTGNREFALCGVHGSIDVEDICNWSLGSSTTA